MLPLFTVTIKRNNRELLVLHDVSSIDYDLMPIGNDQYMPCYRITLCGKIDISMGINDMVDYTYHNPIVLWFAYYVDVVAVKNMF